MNDGIIKDFDYKLRIIKKLISDKYPIKYKELIEAEKRWPKDNRENYFTVWLERNIKLTLEDKTSIEIYAIHYNTTQLKLEEILIKVQERKKQEEKKEIDLDSNIPKQKEEPSRNEPLNIYIPDELKQYIERGIIGTAHNYDYNNVMKGISRQIIKILEHFSDNNKPNDLSYDNFLNYISRNDLNISGIELRNKLAEYYEENYKYTVMTDYSKNMGLDKINILNTNELFAIDILKLLVTNNHGDIETRTKITKLLTEIDLYIAKSELKDKTAVKHKNNIINILSNIKLEELTSYMHQYFDRLDINEVFKEESIEYEEITESAHQVFSNISSYSLKPSTNAILLDGKIQVSSDRGYLSNPNHVQEDSVGSLVKDSNNYINIVADGVGGAEQGDVASSIAVEELLMWYDSLTENELNDTNYLNSLLVEKIKEIDRRIFYEVNGAYSTIVVALTNKDNTIILNTGDSTAYTYDYQTDNLIELTTLDSLSHGLNYEDARHNPINNKITACLGQGNATPHINIIPNDGQKIILSSDGVTDLISEENFKKCFRNNIPSQRIVEKAKFNPDVDSFMKSEDNISAIVVELPQREKMNRRGY